MDKDSAEASDESSEQNQHMIRSNNYTDHITEHPEWRGTSLADSPSPSASTRSSPWNLYFDTIDSEECPLRSFYLPLSLGLPYIPPQTYGTPSASTSQYRRSTRSQEDEDGQPQGGGGWYTWAIIVLVLIALMTITLMLVLYFTDWTTDASLS